MVILKIIGSLIIVLAALESVALMLESHPIKNDKKLSTILDFGVSLAWFVGLMIVNLLAIWSVVTCLWWGWLVLVGLDMITVAIVVALSED